MENGETTHVLLEMDEYLRLLRASEAQELTAKLADATVEWVDLDDFGLQLAASRITDTRMARGLTQRELGKKLGLPQSQISRIERNPDHTTVRTLKRLARALGVDVSALVE